MVQLFINLCGKSRPICIDSTQTIAELKCILNFNEELYSNKCILRDEYTIEHYGLEDNTTIHSNMLLKGGFPISGTLVIADPPETVETGVVAAASQAQTATGLISRTMQWLKDFLAKARAAIVQRMQFIQTILTYIKFFPIITLVLIFLAFLGRPMEFLILIFGLFVVVIIYVLYSVLNLPPFIYIVYLLWFIIMDLCPLILFCMIFGALFALVFLICIILTALNTITGGALKDIVLCDNTPGSWYKTANYHMGNKWERGIFCTRPCYPRYAPDTTGINCVKIPKGYPPYCPQAEIMRIYSSKKADRNYQYADFKDSTNLRYMSVPPAEREQMLKQHYLRKSNFNESCRKSMKEFDTISLNICASADSFEANKHLDAKQVLRLKQVCAQAYCTGSRNYPFCSKISGLKEDDKNAIIKKIIKIIIIILIFCIVFLFTMEYMYKQNST